MKRRKQTLADKLRSAPRITAVNLSPHVIEFGQIVEVRTDRVNSNLCFYGVRPIRKWTHKTIAALALEKCRPKATATFLVNGSATVPVRFAQ